MATLQHEGVVSASARYYINQIKSVLRHLIHKIDNITRYPNPTKGTTNMDFPENWL